MAFHGFRYNPNKERRYQEKKQPETKNWKDFRCLSVPAEESAEKWQTQFWKRKSGKPGLSTPATGGKTMRKMFLFTVITGMLLTSFGCSHSASTSDIPPVQNFSLGKYLGTWYEIARMPHDFERELTDVKAEYTLRSDGKVKVVNSGRKNGKDTRIEGVAQLKRTDGLGELKVSFFRPFYGDYRIIYLKPDYTVAMVTSGTRDYLWILAKTPEIESAQLLECLKLAEKFGFSAGLLQYPNCKLEKIIVK